MLTPEERAEKIVDSGFHDRQGWKELVAAEIRAAVEEAKKEIEEYAALRFVEVNTAAMNTGMRIAYEDAARTVHEWVTDPELELRIQDELRAHAKELK